MPACSASARVVGSFSPGSSSPASMAATMRSTSCWVSDTSESRVMSDKSSLYDIDRPVCTAYSSLVPQGLYNRRIPQCSQDFYFPAVPATCPKVGRGVSRRTNAPVPAVFDVTVRMAAPTDRVALERLAGLDSAHVPSGALRGRCGGRHDPGRPAGERRPSDRQPVRSDCRSGRPAAGAGQAAARRGRRRAREHRGDPAPPPDVLADRSA